MSVTRGQCDARPTFTFPAARHHRPLAGTMYNTWWQRHVCKRHAQGCTQQRVSQDLNLQPSDCQSSSTLATQPHHYHMAWLLFVGIWAKEPLRSSQRTSSVEETAGREIHGNKENKNKRKRQQREVGSTKRLYIYSINITGETMPIGCCQWHGLWGARKNPR